MLSATSANRLRIARWIAASSIALALAACGGGGGNTFVESTPPPPVGPPPPPPAQVVISAPARASVGPNMTRVFASAGGPSFTNGAVVGTTIPLLQTVLLLDETSIRPDPGIYPMGGVAVVEPDGLSINTNGLIDAPSFTNPNLDWTRAGWWAARVDPGPWDYGGPADYRGVFVAGYETPAGEMPTAGSATYSGAAMGWMYAPSNSAPNGLACRCTEVSLGGTATFTADFGARSLSGTLTGMEILGWDDAIGPWNDVTFIATIAGNGFSGSTRVTTAPAGAMGLNATGTLEGRFFGPSAQEAGAVWTLFDGTRSAIGTFGGRRGP